MLLAQAPLAAEEEQEVLNSKQRAVLRCSTQAQACASPQPVHLVATQQDTVQPLQAAAGRCRPLEAAALAQRPISRAADTASIT